MLSGPFALDDDEEDEYGHTDRSKPHEETEDVKMMQGIEKSS